LFVAFKYLADYFLKLLNLGAYFLKIFHFSLNCQAAGLIILFAATTPIIINLHHSGQNLFISLKFCIATIISLTLITLTPIVA
jgi:hypothetical protein